MLKGNFKANYNPANGQSFQLRPDGLKYVLLTLEGKPLEFIDQNPPDTPRIPTMEWCNFAIEKALRFLKGSATLYGLHGASLELDREKVIPTFFFKNQTSGQKLEFPIADFLLRLTQAGDAEKALRNEIARGIGLEEIP